MKNKRFFLIALIVIFLVVIIAMALITFSIKDVSVTYNCKDESNLTYEIEQDFSSLKGRNLIFLSKKRILSILEKYPYFEFVDFEKDFPNKVNIEIKERHKAYLICQDDKNIILSDDGIVLDNDAENVDNLIRINFLSKEGKALTDIKVNDIVGEKITSSQDSYIEVFFSVNSILSSVDCVSDVNIYINSLLSSMDIEFITKTKISLYISEAHIDGIEKTKLAFNKYDSELSDFKKSSESDRILVYKDSSGILQADFTKR